MLNNVAVAELSKGSMKATSLTSPFAVEGFEDKEDFYKSLAPKKSQELKELELDTVQCVSNDIQLKIKIGQNLLRAKKICKHGEFLDWLKACFSWSEDTASRQMRLAEKFESMPGITRFTPTVAYQLSQKSCPDVILEQAIALLDAGEKVTTETVKELKQSVAEEPINLHAVNPKLSKTTRPEGYIKKGDLVEMPYAVKGWSYGLVTKKSTDGIACTIQSISGESLGEKPTKSLSLCPVQKVNPNCISENIELNQRVTIKPYTTELQPFNGSEGKVIFRDEKRRQFSVQIGDMVKDFHWEEIELIPDATEVIVEVQAVEITETETLPNINLKGMGRKQKNQLLKELLKDLQLGSSLASESELEAVNDLVNATLQKMEDLAFSSSLREQFVVIFLDKCL
ncbi:diguanylate cyclase [Planktothrix agardhii NIES-204]|uniref:DUF3102 domain-containing protein n=1 Tax=Planktothrix agardhii TaxID=1160 RepID=UPI000DBB9B61|nr:DUF3102 domain-containing protein [Planktothrix agardhii]MCP9295156.1 DUF3102 domain-containing protein [Planktothrix agardhii LY1]MEA5562826.1 DUF3102 domain-containing protein [Planktothrix agardhii UHCC 0887]BBD56510.1 diguanylate cyclase [Planktothrix agardhii NIES-204]